MIKVNPAPEPEDFDSKVRQRGLRALQGMIGNNTGVRSGKPRKDTYNDLDSIPASKIPPYWRDCLPELMEAYERTCAYMCFYIHRVTGAATVDHMLPKSADKELAYEWSNYRLACSLMNSRKSDAHTVLDPFEVEDGWFCIEFIGYQLVASPYVDEATRARIDQTIEQLKLNDYECCKLREEYVQSYLSGDISFRHLCKNAPFLASELLRHGSKI